MEAISIAKAMAAKTGQRLDPNQELIGQGLANILGAIGKSYPDIRFFFPIRGQSSGRGRIRFVQRFYQLDRCDRLFFFTPLLYHLPQSVLAAVIMMAVIGLINVSGFIHAWEAQWYDGVISIITFVGTLAFAPHLDKGIMIGVVLSLACLFIKACGPRSFPCPGLKIRRFGAPEYHQFKECKYIAMVRFDGPLFFANASYLEDKIMEMMREKKELKHIVIVSNGINDIDASGEETLSLLVDRVRSAGVDISLSGVNESVMSVFKRTHFPEKIGEDHIYPTMEKAIEAIYKDTHAAEDEGPCPLIPAYAICMIPFKNRGLKCLLSLFSAEHFARKKNCLLNWPGRPDIRWCAIWISCARPAIFPKCRSIKLKKHFPPKHPYSTSSPMNGSAPLPI